MPNTLTIAPAHISIITYSQVNIYIQLILNDY